MVVMVVMGRTERTHMKDKTDIQLDFPGNLCRADFVILAMFGVMVFRCFGIHIERNSEPLEKGKEVISEVSLCGALVFLLIIYIHLLYLAAFLVGRWLT